MFVETALQMSAAVFAGNNLAAADDLLTNYRPQQISDFLEDYWRQGLAAWPALNLGLMNGLDVAAHVEAARQTPIDVLGAVGPLVPANIAVIGWHHVAYAYLIENTRIVDIFRRIVYEYLHGERLPQASNATLRWVRTTEELFFSTPRSLTVRSTTSNLRPDDAAVRRNLYYRMLGMDLNHGTEDGRDYPYVKAQSANRDFVVLWEALLTEVWKGFTGSQPGFSAAYETDDNAIVTLVRRIREMLEARRLNGLLSREEFEAVASSSWLRVVVSANTQIVQDLSAQADGEADRLKLIGNKVGLSAHSRADAYFQLAQPMSIVLRAIENQAVETAGAAALYTAGFAPVSWEPQMRAIITHWSIATGRNMKDSTRRQTTLPVLIESARPQLTNGNGGQRPGSTVPAGMLR